MVQTNILKTTLWPHMVVKNIMQETASDALGKERKCSSKLTNAKKTAANSESTHISAGTGTPLLLTTAKIRGACPLLAIAKSILELA